MMKARSHILHKLLDGCVQRLDTTVLDKMLPTKHEYVLYIQLTPLQIDLYRYYIKYSVNATKCAITNIMSPNSSEFFHDFRSLLRICAHPWVVINKSDKTTPDSEESEDEESFCEKSAGKGKDFGLVNLISDNSSEESASESVMETDTPTKTHINDDWWKVPFSQRIEEFDSIQCSGKLVLLFSILEDACNDKLLVFSQSLESLNMIEHFLAVIDGMNWKPGVDYFRLDGNTNIEKRKLYCERFNDTKNSQARLFLISTMAGGLGINLTGANRTQCVFRAYRLGQEKPCFIYRLIALGSIEEQVYKRQVTKLSISKRVIDEHQIDRHYKQHELSEYYSIDRISPQDKRPEVIIPEDPILATQLQNNGHLIYSYHTHDSLLENKVDEGLTQHEIDSAWNQYQIDMTKNEQKDRILKYRPFFEKAELVNLLTLKAKQDHPHQESVLEYIPALLRELHEQRANDDMRMLNELYDIYVSHGKKVEGSFDSHA
ncbi:transcriptional regulator ATRX homolog [Sitodiplosis mosellana]|uniref:transcriptional regulator ATRX homolog n=1 Tax=Sitodiplosis mosellana TaxID=263140 RepID=UPI002444DE78|nr:transcriptional regulator ATRX homolog [Sitodiplosis mosellana]